MAWDRGFGEKVGSLHPTHLSGGPGWGGGGGREGALCWGADLGVQKEHLNRNRVEGLSSLFRLYSPWGERLFFL